MEPALNQGLHPRQDKGSHDTDREAPDKEKELEAPEAHGSSSPRSQNSQSNGSQGTITEDEGRFKSLWMHAYEILRIKDPELVTAYEGYLNSDDTGHIASASPCLSLELISSIITSKLEDGKVNKVVLHLSSEPVKVREQGEKVIKFILWFKTFFRTTILAQPFAALVWSEILNLLRVSLALIKGGRIAADNAIYSLCSNPQGKVKT